MQIEDAMLEDWLALHSATDPSGGRIQADLELVHMHILFKAGAEHDEVRRQYWQAKEEAHARLQAIGLLPLYPPRPFRRSDHGPSP